MRAISNKIEVFKKYFQKKSEVLGYKNGLPFYELFAPLGDSSLSFTYDEAKIFVVDNLTSFSPRLGEYAKKAFCSKWIDATPKEGKRGGAFCSNIHYLGESRILTNFTGSFNDVLTLAHELGHGYHGDCLNRASYLNSDYPMPIAETASTLCETILIRAALKNALKDEASAILENDISSSAQVIVDIYSRFLFESRVFELREKGSLTVKEFKEIMINSQVEAYRGALDSDYLHPYMWVCKPHYYYPDHNFYNFPYAYGLLFAKALYARYEEIGDEFSKLYDDMLAQTGKHDLKGIANIIGMDVTKEEFFINSLNVIEKEIDQLISLL
jgi:oligoendopeptidase F